MIQNISGESETAVKIENAQYVILTGRIKVLKSGKLILEKKQSELKEEKALLKNAEEQKKERVQTSIDKVAICLDSCRAIMAQMTELDATVSEDLLKKVIQTVNDQVAVMDIHNDALKSLLKSF